MEKLNERVGIVVCTRMKSSRIPNKCSVDLNGRSILEHLHTRLLKSKIDITYAYPSTDIEAYKKLFLSFENDKFNRFIGEDEDPLKRMYFAAKQNSLDIIIRVTHDKIFVDEVQLQYALTIFKEKKLDYLYSSSFTAGTAFEIISIKALEEATHRFQKVEHITYAIKAVTDNSLDLDWDDLYFNDLRLLIDFPEDLDLMRTIFANLGNDCSQLDVIKFMVKNSWAKNINKLPKATIYTCAYNAAEWILETMNSVITQSNFFSDYEYILVDDCSNDRTSYLMSRAASMSPNIKYIRNTENLGLASSSNIALSRARGKYIIRLDADDYFIGNNCVKTMLDEIKKDNLDALYPNYYNGDFKVIGLGASEHHPAGTMFKTLALNHIRFKDGLRHFDGKDLYIRAKELLNIGYLNRPIFFYRQHDKSLSKNNLEERAMIKEMMESGIDWHPV